MNYVEIYKTLKVKELLEVEDIRGADKYQHDLIVGGLTFVFPILDTDRPSKAFGSADCEQRYRKIVYIESQPADTNHFRGTAGTSILFKQHEVLSYQTFYNFSRSIKKN